MPHQESLLATSRAQVHIDGSLAIGRSTSCCKWCCYVVLLCFSLILGILISLINLLTCGLVNHIPGLTFGEQLCQRIMRVLMSGFFARCDYGIAGSPTTTLVTKLQRAAEANRVVGEDVQTSSKCYACCYRRPDDDTPLSKKQLVFIWNHGGGYAMGSAYAEAGFSRKVLTLLDEAGVSSIVLAVHYPLLHLASAQSGEAIDAVVAAHGWAVQSCPSAKIILGGDSAGGHLAIVSALNRRLSVDGLVLLSPCCNVNVKTWADEAEARNCTDYISTKLVHIWKDKWCGGEYSHPNVFIDLGNLSMLPGRILVEAGGAEIFRTQIQEFVQAAIGQDKQVDFTIAEFMPHEYMLAPHLENNEHSKEALNRICKFLVSFIA